MEHKVRMFTERSASHGRFLLPRRISLTAKGGIRPCLPPPSSQQNHNAFPPNTPKCVNETARVSVPSCMLVFSFWGFYTQIPTMALPWTPLHMGDSHPRPSFCPPPRRYWFSTRRHWFAVLMLHKISRIYWQDRDHDLQVTVCPWNARHWSLNCLTDNLNYTGRHLLCVCC